jgi:predicted TIM-barrel fold metal-dependent hydrolase
MGFIDAHVHVWTTDTAHYPLTAGFTQADLRPQSFTPEELLAHTRRAGVTHVHLIQPRFYGFDNSYMVDVIRRFEGVFVGTAVIDPHAEGVVDRMAELGSRGVRAFRIHPRLSGRPPATWLRPLGFARMFAAAARSNQAMSCLIDPDGLPEVARMCTEYPDTPVMIDHLARVGGDGHIRDRDVDALCALARHRRVMVKVGAFYALGRQQPPYADLVPLIRRVVEAFGASRCMWESDSPYQVQGPHTYRDSIDLVRVRLDFLSDEDRDWLLRRTAATLLFQVG